jgi:hypothetical protein
VVLRWAVISKAANAFGIEDYHTHVTYLSDDLKSGNLGYNDPERPSMTEDPGGETDTFLLVSVFLSLQQTTKINNKGGRQWQSSW